MRWVTAVMTALLLALAVPAGAGSAPSASAAGPVQVAAAGAYQWSRFSLFGQGPDGYVSADDPRRTGDLNWSLEDLAKPYTSSPNADRQRFNTRFKSSSIGLRGAGPMFGEEVAERNPENTGGYLALEWRTGPLALTLGGGYSEANAFVGGTGSSGGRVYASTGSSSARSAGTRYDALRRWGAYLAAPYQLTERIGLRPELSYFYEDSLSGTVDPGNEWVMGLQFSFGF